MIGKRCAAASVALATTVALTACGSDEEKTTASTTVAETTTVETDNPELTPAAVGDELTDGEASFIIHMMTTDADCDYGSEEARADGAKLVQIRAEVEDRSDDGGFTFNPTAPVNEEGSEIDWPGEMKDAGTGCVASDHSDGYLNWEDDVPTSEQTYVYGDFAVPQEARFLRVRDYVFEIPEEEIDDVVAPEVDPEAEQAPVDPDPEQAPVGPEIEVEDPEAVSPEIDAPDPETARYWAEHPELGNGAVPAPNPMNPDSADGYGPGVELPPFCARFPDHETC
jgi:hypothetical protein